MNVNSDLIKAEEHIRNETYKDAIVLLKSLAECNPTARQMLLHALNGSPDAEISLQCFCNPKGPAEIIHVLGALDEVEDIERLKAMLARPEIRDCDDPSVVHLRSKLRARVSR